MMTQVGVDNDYCHNIFVLTSCKPSYYGWRESVLYKYKSDNYFISTVFSVEMYMTPVSGSLDPSRSLYTLPSKTYRIRNDRKNGKEHGVTGESD